MTSEFIADQCKRRANRGSLAEHPLTKARHDWQTARIANHQCKTYKNLLHTIAITYPGFANQTDRIGQGQSLVVCPDTNCRRTTSWSVLRKNPATECPATDDVPTSRFKVDGPLERIIRELRFIRRNSSLKTSLRLSCPKHRVLKPEAQAKDCAWFPSFCTSGLNNPG